MSYATDDAEMSSARENPLHVPWTALSGDPAGASHDQPDAQRLAVLELVMSQPRDDLDTLQACDRAVTTRVRVMYGMLARAWYSPTTH